MTVHKDHEEGLDREVLQETADQLEIRLIRPRLGAFLACRLLRLILPVFPVCRVPQEKMAVMVTGACKATV